MASAPLYLYDSIRTSRQASMLRHAQYGLRCRLPRSASHTPHRRVSDSRRDGNLLTSILPSPRPVHTGFPLSPMRDHSLLHNPRCV